MGFIGHTRFSLFNPDSPAWLASNGSRFRTSEEYRDYLYSPERLDVRCEIFFGISLPQLKLASEGEDYRHVVSYSDTLPVRYQEKIEKAARDFDFLVLDRHSSVGGSRSLFGVAREMFGPNIQAGKQGRPFGWFRLDDDDLLATDYFQQMKIYITDANAGMQVSLGTGVTGLFQGGTFYNPRVTHHPLIAIGLLNVCKFDGHGALIKPNDAPHNRSDRFNPVILDSRKVSYLWVRHLSQDTALSAPQDTDQSARTLQDMSRFPRVRSVEDLKKGFPILADRFSSAPSPELSLIASTPSGSPLDEEGIRIEVGSASGVLQLEFTLDCGLGAVPGNALIGLSLTDDDGNTLGPNDMQAELREQGLLFSPASGIGHFRYVNTKPGQADYSMTFSLPRGLLCTSIMLRRWKNSELSVDLTRCDVFGGSKLTGVKGPVAKVFVYGSCVSRDPFELETDVQLVDYRSRSSVGSAFAQPPLGWEAHLDLGSVTSPFQRRMVTADVTKTLADDLREADFDALVLDFIDERMSTVEIGGSVVTDSPELAATGFVADPECMHEPWTPEGWLLRKAGITALLGVVDPTQIIVNRAYWATKDDAGQDFAQISWIAKNNAFLRELYEIFEAVPGIRFIDYPPSLLVADSVHRWGRQPYHYITAFNHHFVRQMETMLAER
ncbi:DUF6270 domain-containing protein [Arthrobacter sp. AL08]|uniref:DUF6270 domain-containing protein n=1 Tax=unclassified Arthrobacter TaxID=235627 RepID=UPI00249A649B|nr:MULTISPECIES: DUF6270 domain-containing protein [unclassified Arthrobacter]MDI3242484.1 DUF6270 domain-containing protein [Arthrobacter sp. AL05]MDI3278520.1 DUF6270 domain-containing protein [Arthrobacter sp. AL08]